MHQFLSVLSFLFVCLFANTVSVYFYCSILQRQLLDCMNNDIIICFTRAGMQILCCCFSFSFALERNEALINNIHLESVKQCLSISLSFNLSVPPSVQIKTTLNPVGVTCSFAVTYDRP